MELIYGTKQLSLHDYSEVIVALSARSSQELVMSLMGQCSIDSETDTIFSRMKARPRLAELPLLALHIAHYFVDAELRLKLSAGELVEIYQGVTEKLRTKLPDKEILDMVENAMRVFVEGLYGELKQPPEDLGFNNPYGPTAALAFGTIKDLYDNYSEFHGRRLNVSPMEEIMAMTSIQCYNAAILKSIINSNLTVAPSAPKRATTPKRFEAPAHTTSPLYTPKKPGAGEKIVLWVFAILCVLGLMKIIFRY